MGFKTEGDKNVFKLEQLNLLLVIEVALMTLKPILKDFSFHSTGALKFDLSKNSVFIGDKDTNTILTLNKDGSLTVKAYAKKYCDPTSGKVVNNFNVQGTISAPAIKK